MSPQTAASLLRLVGAGFLLAGLVFALAAFAPVDAPGVLFLDLLKWPLDGNPGALGQDARWLSGVGGGLLAGYAVAILTIIAPAIERGDQGVRRGAVAAILVWFAVDSAGSIASGVGSNAVFNVLFAAMYLFPLVAMKPAAAGRPQTA
ncbi:MAG: hypothetical protein VX640_14065 [Pseudomonadota bacterium]|nr:hypothetical protein [Pseudomonadota bacterium]